MSDKDPLHVLDVTVQLADTPNHNGRTYPKEVLERLVRIHPGTLHGELNPRQQRQGSRRPAALSNIDVDNVSHEISNLRMEGHRLKADVRILPTPSGRDLMKVFDEGRIAMRGFIEQDDNGIVRNLHLVSIDVVSKD